MVYNDKEYRQPVRSWMEQAERELLKASLYVEQYKHGLPELKTRADLAALYSAQTAILGTLAMIFSGISMTDEESEETT